MRRRTLMPEEMASRRETGLCYNCKEGFMTHHRCKRLFLLISPSGDVNNDYNDEEKPAISLYALAGIQPWSCRTMQLQVNLVGTTLTMLLDTGSTHNFISNAAVQQGGLPTHVQSTGLGHGLRL